MDHLNFVQGLDLTRYHQMSKASFSRHCLLVLLVDFVILLLFKQELVICLLFCKSLLAVTLFIFKKLLKKNSHLCRYVTYHNL